MKWFSAACALLCWITICPPADGREIAATDQNVVSDIKELLNQLESGSENAFFRNHCRSIVRVMDGKASLTKADSLLIGQMFLTFSTPDTPWCAADLSSYLERKRPFILSWVSPTDGAVSLAWFVPPENWDPDKTYPLYVRLHGLSSPYASPIEYMAYNLRPESYLNTPFEDGYLVYPWGRGNIWYEGIGETDVWECIQAVEPLIKMDPARKYLMGMSMGGYGAWKIGVKSADTWAALGIYAAALWHGGPNVMNADAIDQLKNVPVFFICGTSDGLMSENQQAYQLLQDAGNSNLAFETFNGGHESRVECWRSMYEWVRIFSKEDTPVMNEQNQSKPIHFGLPSNYPNPFNAVTHIRFNNPETAWISLSVYDVQGCKVRDLVDAVLAPGGHEAVWNASDNPSGLYFCTLRTGKFAFTNKMILIR